jgi:hypothetical protein
VPTSIAPGQLRFALSTAASGQADERPSGKAEAREGEARHRRLPELYYLQNFRLALQSLREKYSDLLSDSESAFIRQFAAIPERTQCLVTRMVMRKGPVFRRASLEYPEVGDLDAALQDLANLHWAELDASMTMEELHGMLTRQDRRLVFGTVTGRRAHVGDSGQLTLPLLAEQVAPRPFSQWHPQLANSHIRLTIEITAKRLELLYFGNDHQTWAEFVISDLGLQKYERVAYDGSSRAFSDRKEIEHFYRLSDCRARLRAGEPAPCVLEHAQIPAGVTDWLRERFAKLHLRLAEMLDRDGHYQLAIQTYRGCATAAACIRLMRLQERLGLNACARATAAAALELHCNEVEQRAIARTLKRVFRRLGDSSPPAMPRPKPAVIAVAVAKPGGRERVERQVCGQISTPRSPAFYVENGLFPSLFGLLCWDAIFAPLPGAFFHPFQTGPADLYTRQFAQRRRTLFDSRLALLDSGAHAEVIRRHFRDKTGVATSFVHWSRLRPQLLELALLCIPSSHLKVIFGRMLDDLENHCSGLPDLVQFVPEEQRYQLIEVKAPGDRLQNNQRGWMDFFGRHGIPAAVCKVSWLES